MGYANIREREKQGTWADAIRRVFSFLFRRSGEVSAAPVAIVRQSSPSPYVQRDGVVLSFRVGCRYFNSTKNRVFECIALKGKRARSVAFSCLDKVDEDKATICGTDRELYSWMWHKARIDGGVETCERGALRADRQATETEVAGELSFLADLRAREKG